jgi:hypothetical protein
MSSINRQTGDFLIGIESNSPSTYPGCNELSKKVFVITKHIQRMNHFRYSIEHKQCLIEPDTLRKTLFVIGRHNEGEKVRNPEKQAFGPKRMAGWALRLPGLRVLEAV